MPDLCARCCWCLGCCSRCALRGLFVTCFTLAPGGCGGCLPCSPAVSSWALHTHSLQYSRARSVCGQQLFLRSGWLPAAGTDCFCVTLTRTCPAIGKLCWVSRRGRPGCQSNLTRHKGQGHLFGCSLGSLCYLRVVCATLGCTCPAWAMGSY